MSFKSRRACAVIAAGALAASVGFAVPGFLRHRTTTRCKKLTKAVTLEGVMDHLEALQDIADPMAATARPAAPATRPRSTTSSSSSRPPGTTPRCRRSSSPTSRRTRSSIRISPNPQDVRRRNRLPAQHLRLRHARGHRDRHRSFPVGLVHRPDPAPANSSTSGCEAADFAGFPAGGIALDAARHVRVRRQGAQRAGGRRSRRHHHERGPARPHGLINMIGDATGLTIPAVFATPRPG